MTREQLDAAHSAAITRHWRGLADNGAPTQALLAELADTAEEHAVNRLAAQQLSDAAVEAWIRDHPDAFEAWVKVHGKTAAPRRPAARTRAV